MAESGTHLRDARLARGFTVAETCRGITYVYEYLAYESNQVSLPPDITIAVAERLGVQLLLDPRSSHDHVELAVQLEAAARLGDWHTMEFLLRSLPGNEFAQTFFTALVDERKGDFATALERLGTLRGIASAPLWTLRVLVAICRCARDSGDLEISVAAGEEALSFVRSLDHIDDEIEAELRATLAGTYCETGDITKALDLTDIGLEEVQPAPWATVTLHWARAMTLQTLGRFAEAHDAANIALRVLRTLERPSALARMQNAAAWIALQVPGFDVEMAYALLRESEDFFRQVGAPLELALVLTTRAEFEVLRNERDLAIGLAHAATSLLDNAEAGERARITAAAAQIYASVGDHEESMRHLLQARHLLEESGARRSAAGIWKQMAETYAALGQVDLQVACLRAAMELLAL